MNANSRLFDRIRVKPPADESEAGPAERLCDHPGCRRVGEFRAPKGRFQEGQYHQFCLDHVRAYNQTYNYFNGMGDEAVQAYQRDAMTGHRPTWRMGVNAAGAAAAEGPIKPGAYTDPLGVFGLGGFDPGRRAKAPEEERNPVGNAARKAMETLGVDPGTPAADIKARYKGLVKRLHPDANGGDRSNEDRLRECINAYNLLRASGYA